MPFELVSCIVPVFNGERYLSETLDSILAQTYRPIEVLVIDDGSSDGTREVAARYGDRVRCCPQTHAGPTVARNKGVALAQGAFIAFLDADDLWHPEKLARQHQRFLRNPALMICCTHIQNFWTPELPESPQVRRLLQGPVPGYLTVTLLARRSAFEKIGVFNPRLPHIDKTDWFLRAAEAGLPTEMLPDVMVRRRLHGGNISFRRAVTSRDEYLAMVKASLDRRRGRDAGGSPNLPAPLKGAPDVDTV